jgi:VanZ family protein
MASSEQVQMLERRIVMSITVAVFLVVLATFAGVLFTHRNTFAIVEPLIRRMRPGASPAEIERLHNIARKLGHFLIPAGAFAALVIGPLRKRPAIALALCALFATIDECLQSFTPGRNGSLDDVILDTSGALFAYFVYRVITSWQGTAKVPVSRYGKSTRRRY